MISGTWNNLRVDDEALSVSVTRAWHRDVFEIYIWERKPGERGAHIHHFGEGGKIEKVFVPEGEAVDRPSLEVSAHIAPAFFRLMGMAADQLGVLPDVVAAQTAKLEAEVRLLREMLDRTDKSSGDHISDIRLMARQAVYVPRSDGGF